MKESTLLKAFGLFLIGLAVGGIGGVTIGWYASRAMSTFGNTLNTIGWQERAYHAYRTQQPEVAKWALENLAEILEVRITMLSKDHTFSFVSPEDVKGDAALTYARLALINQVLKADEEYKACLSKAVTLARESFAAIDRVNNEEDLLAFVKKIDAKASPDRHMVDSLKEALQSP